MENSFVIWFCLILFPFYLILIFTVQEIQKIVVFEGAFEKIFSIIKEEGGSEGGVVVQVLINQDFDLMMILSHQC